MVIASTAIQSLLAFAFLVAGGMKLAGLKMHVDQFDEWGYPQWFRTVTGSVEVVGAVGLTVGIWYPEVAIAAGIWLVGTMIGAAYTDLFRSSDRTKVMAPALLLGLAAAVVVLRSIELARTDAVASSTVAEVAVGLAFGAALSAALLALAAAIGRVNIAADDRHEVTAPRSSSSP